MTCQWKIRLFPNATELTCEKDESGHRTEHEATLRDYAYPGSATVVTWAYEDRRSFVGEWAPCPNDGCVLPARHPRGHAT